ncbi:MAG: hypothetical protein Kow00109_30480 [Acidobacteriota bacterium]
MSDELKSAVELALEKLDRELGASVPLSDEAKQKISEIRAKYQSKIAQEEITAQERIRAAVMQGDFATVEQVQARLAEEKRRLEEACEKEVAKIREADQKKTS